MDGIVWISCARYPHQWRKGEKNVGITLRKRDRVVRYSTQEVREVFLVQLVLLRCGLSHLAFGPFASAAGARAVPTPPTSSPISAVAR